MFGIHILLHCPFIFPLIHKVNKACMWKVTTYLSQSPELTVCFHHLTLKESVLYKKAWVAFFIKKKKILTFQQSLGIQNEL